MSPDSNFCRDDFEVNREEVKVTNHNHLCYCESMKEEHGFWKVSIATYTTRKQGLHPDDVWSGFKSFSFEGVWIGKESHQRWKYCFFVALEWVHGSDVKSMVLIKNCFVIHSYSLWTVYKIDFLTWSRLWYIIFAKIKLALDISAFTKSSTDMCDFCFLYICIRI